VKCLAICSMEKTWEVLLGVMGIEVGTCGIWLILVLVRKTSKGNTQGSLKR
jgi:hypothetical protein